MWQGSSIWSPPWNPRLCSPSPIRGRTISLKVAIVGGGIAGLTAAYELQRAGSVEVSLFERSSVAGGKIWTAHEGGLLIEQGPDSIFASKPWAIDLICELGLEADLMGPLSNEFSILSNGKLHTVPRALANLVPSSAGALEKAGFLSSADKKRALKEADIAAGGGEDESIASFFGRRFGRGFSTLVAEPLLAGTHAGDPKKLSMAALYPTYLGMERSHGSISRAASARTASSGSQGAGFLTLRGGMDGFPRRLSQALNKVRISLSTEVQGLRSDGAGLTLDTSHGPVTVDHAILSTPAYVSSTLLQEVAPTAAEGLMGIRFVSTAVATLAYRREAFPRPVTGNGFLVPYTESSPISGCTWSSNKWSERALDDVLLVRAFMGRDGGLEVDRFRDEELVAFAERELANLLRGSQPPFFTRLDRWSRGMAQYELGHLDRLASIENALGDLPISLAGSSYRGISISDCVRQGWEAASKLVDRHT